MNEKLIVWKTKPCLRLWRRVARKRLFDRRTCLDCRKRNIIVQDNAIEKGKKTTQCNDRKWMTSSCTTWVDKRHCRSGLVISRRENCWRMMMVHCCSCAFLSDVLFLCRVAPTHRTHTRLYDARRGTLRNNVTRRTLHSRRRYVWALLPSTHVLMCLLNLLKA